MRADPRPHFYVAGFSYQPAPVLPHLARIAFGLAKPDLVHVRKDEAGIELQIIDAKSSRAVKVRSGAQ